MDLTNDYPGFQRQGGVWASAVRLGWRDMQACRPGSWNARNQLLARVVSVTLACVTG